MRTSRIIWLSCCLAHAASASSTTSQTTYQSLLGKAFSPTASLFGMVDNFQFNSQQGDLFNRYNGVAKLGSVGADNVKIKNLYTGLNIYHINSHYDSSARLTQSYSQSNTNIDNNGIYIHAMKALYKLLYVDVFGGYGRNTFTISSLISTPGFEDNIGGANYHGSNNYVGLRTFFAYPYRKWLLAGNINFVSSRLRQSQYTLTYDNAAANSTVANLTTSVDMLTENARLFYRVNDAFSPFISAGLIQVTRFSYSRPVVTFTPIAPLPTLTLDESGYSWGAGVVYKIKSLRLTPWYQQIKRGSVFRSDVAMLRADFLFDS